MMGQITYQLNPLLEAQKTFSAMETRLFYLGLQSVNPHISENDKYFDEQFPDTVITPSELTKIFGHTQYITEVDKATDNLIGRYISIKFEDGFEKYTIFQHIKYKKEKGLYIKFSEDMRPFILDIYKSYKKYGFTKIEMKQIFYLSSAYAMRILELLLQYKSTAKMGVIEREILIDDLRKKLNVPENAYIKRINNFKQRVLDLPIRDINTNTQYNVSYLTIKHGRSVIGFRFFCNCNNVKSDNEYTETVESDENTIEKQLERDGQTKLFDSLTANEPPAHAVPGLTEEQQDLIDRLINRGVSAETAEILVKKYPPEVISSNLKHAVQQKDTAKNLAGLIIKFIENDIAGNQEKAKKEAKEREDKRQKERRLAYGITEKNREEQTEEKIDLENISDEFKRFLNVKKGGK